MYEEKTGGSIKSMPFNSQTEIKQKIHSKIARHFTSLRQRATKPAADRSTTVHSSLSSASSEDRRKGRMKYVSVNF
jgi:macrodomain Ter protein organizer (MatP/YcbG family)